MATTKLRIGIFAGTFDPVHAGHIAFALQALQAGGLDEAVFLPERQPRHARAPEHYAHRVAMLKRALRPHPHFSVLELVDVKFSVARTWPQLRALFAGHELVLLMGAEVATGLGEWRHSKQLLAQTELIIGVDSLERTADIEALAAAWPAQPRDMTFIECYAPDISSEHIRQALRADQAAAGLLTSVRGYARREWLYIAPADILAGLGV